MDNKIWPNDYSDIEISEYWYNKIVHHGVIKLDNNTFLINTNISSFEYLDYSNLEGFWCNRFVILFYNSDSRIDNRDSLNSNYYKKVNPCIMKAFLDYCELYEKENNRSLL